MFNKLQFSLHQPNRMGIIALLCGFALIASACGGVVVNSPDSTPTTAKEVVSSQDVCSLITAAEAEAVMGQPVASILPFSELDSDYGEMVFSCYYNGKDLTIVVSTVDLGSAQAASEILQQQLVKEQADEGAIINEEPGLGEKAYWTTADNAGMYTILKGSNIFVVLLGGNIGDAASYKAPLLTLAKSVSSKY